MSLAFSEKYSNIEIMETEIVTIKLQINPTLFVGNLDTFVQDKSVFSIISKTFKLTEIHNSNYLPIIA